tara:strand:- start:2803 stop:4365 length:1563 start_codon:yes stop_codon:yes gene_type:complete
LKFILLICFSLLNYFPAYFSLKAAEKINLKFEGMSIPLSIDELSKLDINNKDSTELIDWFRKNGLEKVFQLSKYLEFPIFKQDGFSKQILRSWIGKKVLTELSDTFIVPNDKNGIKVFNTIESLLDKKQEISTLDILREIPIETVEIDIDNLLTIISSWKKALEDQQNLAKRFTLFVKKENNINNNFDNDNDIKSYSKQINLDVSHRENPLSLEIWYPNKKFEKELIIFMPGLGGDISNFRWLGSGLSKRGWPVMFIEHEGSNSEAFNASIMRGDSLPGGADIFLYRLKDLDEVINALRKGYFDVNSKSYILMGHSLGSLISILYEGNPPKKDFVKRCEKGLDDFALTNLSKLLQCQLIEIPIPEFKESLDLKAIIGFNSFGSLIWPTKKSSGIEVPILFIGGTFDLITPLLDEQFKLFVSNQSNKLNRFLVVEGASHFSPIRVVNEMSVGNIDNDVFKIKKDFVGINPYDFQKLSLSIIIEFLVKLDQQKALKITQENYLKNFKFYLFGEKEINQINNY